MDEKIKALGTKEEIKTLATKSELKTEQDEIEKVQTYDCSLLSDTITFLMMDHKIS